ncbi:hypothetical protein EVAR_66562_1 [Eumeta japonica]|uniref:Uncharacterized protein n=1 Tax=Eumeta variegata TaxID=151549 RepID=A0A4C1ZJA4_EUMVA|nr:hypothetical protein EVAR_66562_1 [Eumeta japonica]
MATRISREVVNASPVSSIRTGYVMEGGVGRWRRKWSDRMRRWSGSEPLELSVTGRHSKLAELKQQPCNASSSLIVNLGMCEVIRIDSFASDRIAEVTDADKGTSSTEPFSSFAVVGHSRPGGVRVEFQLFLGHEPIVRRAFVNKIPPLTKRVRTYRELSMAPPNARIQ